MSNQPNGLSFEELKETPECVKATTEINLACCRACDRALCLFLTVEFAVEILIHGFVPLAPSLYISINSLLVGDQWSLQKRECHNIILPWRLNRIPRSFTIVLPVMEKFSETKRWFTSLVDSINTRLSWLLSIFCVLISGWLSLNWAAFPATKYTLLKSSQK